MWSRRLPRRDVVEMRVAFRHFTPTELEARESLLPDHVHVDLDAFVATAIDVVLRQAQDIAVVTPAESSIRGHHEARTIPRR